jgi:hypothetical protein
VVVHVGGATTGSDAADADSAKLNANCKEGKRNGRREVE